MRIVYKCVYRPCLDLNIDEVSLRFDMSIIHRLLKCVYEVNIGAILRRWADSQC